MISDSVFLIFRRFDHLAARNLLYLQDELFQLEDQLRKLDQQDLSEGEQGLKNLSSWREDRNTRRKQVVLEIRQKLDIYRTVFYFYSLIPSVILAYHHDTIIHPRSQNCLAIWRILTGRYRSGSTIPLQSHKIGESVR